MFYTDILTPGYSEKDTPFTYDYMHLINEIYVDDALITYDNLRMPSETKMSSVGYMENYTHLGSAYCIHPDITQNSLKMCMMKLKIIQNNTIAVLVLHNTYTWFYSTCII